MRTCIVGLLLLLLNSLAVADEPIRLAVKNGSGVQLQVTGQETIKCNSRWHANLSIRRKIASKTVIPADLLAEALPNKPVALNDQWQLPEPLLKLLATALFDQRRITVTDENAYAHWTGGGVQSRSWKAEGELHAKFKAVDETPRGPIARITLLGKVGYATSHQLSNRFGPNTLKESGLIPVSGELSLNLQHGTLESLQLSLEGVAEGSYSNATPKFVEPYTINMVLQAVLVAPLTPEQTAKAKRLIAQLGADIFADREAAQKQLQKFGAAVTPLLLDAAKTSKDLEIRQRATQLARILGEG